MKQRIIIAVLTVVVFGAGFGARMWTEGRRPLPPPPAALGSEFGGGGAPTGKKETTRQYDRAKLVADIESLRPQIEAYRARFEAIDAEFETAFVQILTPEQNEKYVERRESRAKRRAEIESRAAAMPAAPLSDEEIANLRQKPFERVYWKIAFMGRLGDEVKYFKLNEEQRAALLELLRQRREKFIALIDSTPSPTFKLTILASDVKRLVGPASEPETPQK